MYKLNFNWIDKQYFYDGDDLGATILEDRTVFKTWAPMATCVYINLYLDGTGDNRIETALKRALRARGFDVKEKREPADGKAGQGLMVHRADEELRR